MSLFDLSGKTIIISGASSGIGRACAILCSQVGASVAILGRNQKRLDETMGLMAEGNHKSFSADIGEYDKIPALISNIVTSIGPIDGFVHSAGIELTQPFQMTSHEEMEEVYSLNVIAGYELLKSISKKKHINPNGASIVFISSIMGMVGKPGIVSYCSSKGALIAGVKALALEYASKKIRINCISPAVVETEMVKKTFATISEDAVSAIKDKHPLGLGKPEDVAGAAVYLLSDMSQWVTGSNLVIDGGYTAQ